jgi:hypothetical protein
VHLPPGSHYCIDRARRQAFGAPDAQLFIDYSDEGRTFDAVLRIQRQSRTVQQSRQGGYGCRSARGALIDLGHTTCDRLGVWAAALVPAAGALSLREQGIDVVAAHHDG